MWLAEPEDMKQVLLETPLELETEDALDRTQRGQTAQGSPVSVQEALRTMPVVSIGQPETWPLREVYPLRQMPGPLRTKAMNADYYLVRLCCSFRPIHHENRIQWARFRVSLLPNQLGQSPIASDLYPLEVIQEVKHQISVSLAPTLKFQVVEVNAGKIDFGLEYRELQPRISASGVGQADPMWDYSEVTGSSIQGSKWMYLLVKAPKGMALGQATLDLLADVEVRGLRLPVVIRHNRQQSAPQLIVQLWG